MQNKQIIYVSVGIILLIGAFIFFKNAALNNKRESIRSGNRNIETDNSSSNNNSTNSGLKVSDLTKSKQSEPGNNSPIKITNHYSVSPKKDYIAPRWSPNGLDIVYTGPKYKGLYLASADGTRVKKISDDNGIGYNVRWSPDGSRIISTVHGTVKVYDITGDEVTENKEPVEDKPVVFARNNNIYYNNPYTGNEEKLTNGEDTFYNPKLSPDEKKVSYVGMVTGIYIRDLDSAKVVHIGPGTDVQWYPNSKGVIYNYTQDDGSKIIASDIFFAYADGLEKYNITKTPDIIELKPQVSPDGSKITYEVDGQIFVAEIHGL